MLSKGVKVLLNVTSYNCEMLKGLINQIKVIGPTILSHPVVQASNHYCPYNVSSLYYYFGFIHVNECLTMQTMSYKQCVPQSLLKKANPSAARHTVPKVFIADNNIVYKVTLHTNSVQCS